MKYGTFQLGNRVGACLIHEKFVIDLGQAGEEAYPVRPRLSCSHAQFAPNDGKEGHHVISYFGLNGE